jgi:hypothetical protein
VLRVRRCPEFPSSFCTQAVLLHETFNSLVVNVTSLPSQRTMDLRAPVIPATLLVDRPDLL